MKIKNAYQLTAVALTAVDAGSNVHELYNNGQWFNNRLTNGAKNAPGAGEAALSGCFDIYNVEHVFYIDQVNHVRERTTTGSGRPAISRQLPIAPAQRTRVD